MTKGALNIFSLVTYAFTLTPMGLFYEKQYFLAMSAFIIGFIVHLLTPMAVGLRKESKWYRQYVYIVYPAISVISVVFGFLNFLLGQISLVVIYFFWSNAMWSEIRRQLFPDDSLGDGNNTGE